MFQSRRLPRRSVLLGAAALPALSLPAIAQKRVKCVIANSRYTGWEPIWLARDLGILKKWGDKYGVELSVTAPMKYLESYTQFGNGAFGAVAVTNMDALNGPCAAGLDTSFVVVGDYSNGNDGVVGKSSKTLKPADIVGKKVVLVEETVSHYLLWRMAQMENLPFNKIGTKNSGDDVEVKDAFHAQGDGAFAITWNPNLLTIREDKGVQMIFDSSRIPGEIIDGIVVNNDQSSPSYVPESARKAIAGAWYEVMGLMAQAGPLAHADAIAHMAKGVEQTPAQFQAQLDTTALFYSPKDAVSFTQAPQLKKTMDRVRTFSAELKILKNNAGQPQGPDFVGIEFPDGSTMGDKNNVKLRFDTTYMQMAADGKL